MTTKVMAMVSKAAAQPLLQTAETRYRPPAGYVVVEAGDKRDCNHPNTVAFNPDATRFSHGEFCTDCNASWGLPKSQKAPLGARALERRSSVKFKSRTIDRVTGRI